MLLAAGWLTWGLAESAIPQTAEPGGNARALEPQRKSGKELRAALNQPVTLDKGIDPGTPLKDALDFFAERYDLTIIVDSKAFEAIGVQKVEEVPIALPRLRDVRLGVVLRLLLGQIKGDTHAGAFLVRADFIEITTTHDALTTVAGKDAAQLLAATPGPARVLNILHTDFDKKPLSTALAQLADATGISIVIDPRVGEKGQTLVNGTFNNVFVDTTIHLLADMADLRAVQKDTVFYITTRENARAFEAAHQPPPALAPQPRPRPNDGLGAMHSLIDQLLRQALPTGHEPQSKFCASSEKGSKVKP